MSGLSVGADEDAPGTPPPEPDRYAREALLAVGGMGRVYLTYDRRLGRWVAVKEAVEGPTAAAALLRESAMIAALEHPGIVAVHDAGTTDDGRPWIAMRLVRGRTLESVVADRPTLAERLPLLTHFRDTCHAVAYAHHEGVLHRDLKPSNVLVGAFGETQVVDWGLAVRADAARAEVAGTPAWMAPEQARGEAADARTDVWGLGALLRFVLTGAPGVDGALGDAPPELAAIVARALAPRRDDRYPTAQALADDVERYLTGARVQAHQYGAFDLLARFVRVWRAPLAVAAVASVALIAGAASSARRLASERDRAVAAEAVAARELATSLAVQARQAATVGASGRAGVLGTASLAWGDDPDARGAVVAARSAWPVARVASEPVGDCPNAQLVEGGWICRTSDALRWLDHGVERWRAPVAAVAVEVSGPLVAAQRGHEVVVLDAATGAVRSTFPRKSPLPLLGAHDGRFASRRWEGESWWGGLDPVEREPLASCEGHGRPRDAALHPTLPLHAAWCADGTVAVTDGAGRVTRHGLGLSVEQHGDVAGLRWSPDGRHLALVWYLGRVGWLDVATGRLEHALVGAGTGASSVAVAPDGRRLAVRRDDGGVDVWTTSPLAVVAGLPVNRVVEVGWAADGRLRTLTETAVDAWEVRSQDVPPVVPLGLGVAALTFTPEGDALVTTHSDGVVVATAVTPGGPSWRRTVDAGVVKSAHFTRDGDALVLMPSEGRAVRSVDRHGNGLREGVAPLIGRAALPLDDGGLLMLPFGGGVERWDGVRWTDAGCGPAERRTYATSREGTALLVSVDGVVSVVRDGRCVGDVPGLVASAAALSDDATWLVATTPEGLVRASLDGVVAWRSPASARDASVLALSPDGRLLATGGLDRVVRLVDARDGRPIAALRGHGHRVSALGFSPDGRRLASGSWDGTARLWSTDAVDAPADVAAAVWDELGWPSAEALLGVDRERRASGVAP